VIGAVECMNHRWNILDLEGLIAIDRSESTNLS